MQFPLSTAMIPLLVSSAVVIAALWIVKSLATRANSKRPPGPPRLPFIGNALQIPTKSVWLYYTELSRIYGTPCRCSSTYALIACSRIQLGDVVYLSAFGQSILVLNSLEANTDLLVKKATISSGRPSLTMVMDM